MVFQKIHSIHLIEKNYFRIENFCVFFLLDVGDSLSLNSVIYLIIYSSGFITIYKDTMIWNKKELEKD